MKKVIVIVFVSLFVLLKGYSQTVEIYEDSRGNKYAAIHSKGLPENKVENRNDNVEFYTNIQLYEYTSNGQNTSPILDENGNSIFVNRIARHTSSRSASRIDWKVSLRFIISPDVVYSEGNDSEGNNQGTVQMNWATANGYLATANGNSSSTQSFAVPKGCAMYRGKDGKDEPGTWRTPTFREGSLIMVYYKELEATADKGTDFKPFANSTVSTTPTTYWLATEYNNNTEAWKITFYPDATKVKYTSGRNSKTASYYLRCIRDIP